MAMVKCKACSEELSTEAKICPKCGHPNKASKNLSGLQIVIGLSFAFLVFLFVAGSIDEHNQPSFGQQFDDEMLADFLSRYSTAKSFGATMDMCVTAGFISSKYLNREDEPNYRKWTAIENADCALAW